MDDRFRHKCKVGRIRAGAALAILALSANFAFAQPPTIPFKPGEKLLFRANWLLFDAGMVEASAPEVVSENGKKFARLTLHTWTTATIAHIFHMDDFFESQWDLESLCPRQFTAKIRETNTNKDKHIEFDHAAGKATVIVNNDPPKTLPLSLRGQDFLSASYFTRTRKLEPKKRIMVPVFEDNKNYQSQIDVIKRERIRVMDGEVDTIMVIAKLKFEGAFQNRNALYIWLTDDDYHVPVKLEMSFIFGTITLDLVQADAAEITIIRTEKKQ